jgi:hypothetical protein
MVGAKLGNTDKRVQCWVGKQTAAMTRQAPEESHGLSPTILAQTGSSSSSASSSTDSAEVATELAQTKNRLGNLKDLPVEERIILAQTINESDLSWTADPYLDTPVEGALSLAQTSSRVSAEEWN